MPFSTAQLARIKAELGYNLLEVGATAYIGISSLFESVINENIAAEVTTTSSTAVTAASAPTPVALTLASATGFTAGDLVVVDVDSRLEKATVSALSGAVITVQLSLAHSGTYPVTVEGPITVAKEILARIDQVKREMATAMGHGTLKQVDEVHFYQSARGRSQFGELGHQLAWWRSELASVLGAPNLWQRQRGASRSLAVY